MSKKISRPLRVGLVALAVLMGLPSAGAAQSQDLLSGTRVRVTTTARRASPRAPRIAGLPAGPGAPRIAGLLVSISDMDVTIVPDRATAPLMIPKATILGIERSTGRRSRWRGAAVGAVIGGFVGAVVGLASERCGAGDLVCLEALAALGGGMIGAAGGAAVGAALPPAERCVVVNWRRTF